MVTWTCEISGEPLSEDVVVTPSGHVCRKKLLLQKLAENGGLDPFQDDTPLSESDLIALSKNSSVIPPRTSDSMVSTMNDLQSQYDALILELFDTRKLLTNTRQELSQAMYQNDAAVRVIARLIKERDQAREQLKTWNATGRPADAASDDNDEPASKKTKLSSTSLPQADSDKMLETWNTLQPNRKARQKELAASALTEEQLNSLKLKASSSKAASGALPSSLKTSDGTQHLQQLIEDTLIVYNHGKKSWSAKPIQLSETGTCSDVREDGTCIVGLESGNLDIVSLDEQAVSGTIPAEFGKLVDVRLHPDNVHMCACSEAGVIIVGNLESKSIVGSFPSNNTYSAGALHPDGLIYIAGDSTGNLHILDFKSQAFAGSMQGESAVVSIDISSNGYYVGVAYENGDVKVWDLRKQSIAGILNENHDIAKVISVQFDKAGKYLAFAGGDSLTVQVVTAKKWESVATMSAPKLVSHAGLQWGDKWIAAAGLDKKAAKVAIFEA